MASVADFAEALRQLPGSRWRRYMAEHSGLPGPRGNLELAQAVADAGDTVLFHQLAESDDEYEALCGAVGLGRLLADGDDGVARELEVLAGDARWRVREGVAMGLQRPGDADIDRLLALVARWAGGPPLVQRAAVAGICEPRLLRAEAVGHGSLDLLDSVTRSLASLPSERRGDEDVRVLRKALGYCWSVAVAAVPEQGFPRLERWAGSDDPDVQWMVRENLKKKRLQRHEAGFRRLQAMIG